METQASLKTKFQSVWKHFDERTRRLMAANEAIHLGRGGISAVNKACGLTRKSISQGIREINEGINPVAGHVRLSGGGRKRITDTDPEIVVALESILNDDTIGDPETPLRWTCKSTRTLAKQLEIMKHPVSHTKIANILHDLGYSLQGNRKTARPFPRDGATGARLHPVQNHARNSAAPHRDGSGQHRNFCRSRTLCQRKPGCPAEIRQEAGTVLGCHPMRSGDGATPVNRLDHQTPRFELFLRRHWRITVQVIWNKPKDSIVRFFELTLLTPIPFTPWV